MPTSEKKNMRILKILVSACVLSGQIERKVVTAKTIRFSTINRKLNGVILLSNSKPRMMVIRQNKLLSHHPSPNMVRCAAYKLKVWISFWIRNAAPNITVVTKIIEIAC
jgi:hypothetical protein